MNAQVDTVERETTVAALRSEAQPREANLPAVRAGFNDLQGFELLQRAAKALSSSSLVPQQFQGNVPNSIIAIEMAQRIGASPLMVAQNLYVVHGRPSWSAKFLIATFNQCGRFSALRYEWQGERDTDAWGCRAWAVEKETGQKITGALITIGLAKKEGWYQKSGSKWQTIPEQMLMYRSAAWLVNTHAPEISMGLNTDEELHDVYDAERGADGTFEVQVQPVQGAPATNGAGQAEQPQAEVEGDHYDEAGAVAAIRACKSLKKLEALADEIRTDFVDTGREVPIAVTAAIDGRREVLEAA